MMSLKFIFTFLLLFIVSLTMASVDDSVGVVLRDGKVFILHKVESGQGLFGVARRYKTVWTSIRDANPGSDKSLLPGQVLLVPTGKSETQYFKGKTPKYSKNNNEYSKPKKKEEPEVKPTLSTEPTKEAPKTSFTIYYTVQKGETLFSIAQKFNTTVYFLKQLNHLKTETVEVGKDLLVPMTDVTKTDTLIIKKEAEIKKTTKELDDLAAQIALEKKREKTRIDSILAAATMPDIDKKENKKEIEKEIEKPNEKPIEKPTDSKTEYTISTENYPEYDVEKITETGFGKVSNDTKLDQTKDWVIHHNAPENTIILITNPANNKTVYCKVVKNFSRTDKDPLIIYLTKNTAEILELSKKDKFSIKISFAK